jgi:hypothetical protein
MHRKTAIWILVALAFIAPARAQDASLFHVKSVHKETPAEHGGEKTNMRYLKVVGTFEGKTYTIEALDAGWNEVLEPGKDYPATVKKNTISIEIMRKGKREKNPWEILTIEE